MNNKTVSLKENNLGIKGWVTLYALLLGGNRNLKYLGLSLVANLSKEQVLRLIKELSSTVFIKDIFLAKNDKLKEDKEIIIAALSNAPYFDINSIYDSLYEDQRDDIDVIVAYIRHITFSETYKTFMTLSTNNTSLLKNKKFVMATLSNTPENDIEKIYQGISDELKKDADVLCAFIQKIHNSKISFYLSLLDQSSLLNKPLVIAYLKKASPDLIKHIYDSLPKELQIVENVYNIAFVNATPRDAVVITQIHNKAKYL